jgi:selenide,water dikinase
LSTQTTVSEHMSDIKLTQYSHGAGCGCKIAPAVLDTILHSNLPKGVFPSLLVGHESKDDAAVYDLGDGTCIISTTDFFMPIVDDPATFGAIASVNAISDVYAMGGEPLMAIAILGWPVNTVPAAVANEVLEGSRKICQQAGIPLAGGHSIDCPEPVFGLAVTGKVKKENIKQNNTAKVGSVLYLTKPLGIGIVTTAQKKGIVKDEHLAQVVTAMTTLNKPGAAFGKLSYVNAMTDVTGFGLLGHLVEVCEGSGLSAEINYDQIPKFDFLEGYLNQKSTRGGHAA